MLKLSVSVCSFCLLMATVLADLQVVVPDSTYAVEADGGSVGGPSTPSGEQNVPGDESRSAGADNVNADRVDITNVIRPSLSVVSATNPLATTSIQHHILPAQTIPLPLTISTRPGLRTVIAPETITIHEPTVAKVGEVVHKIPTAVSHQSQTVVHKHADIVTPIVAPAVRTISSQVVRAYHTPLVYAAQVPVVVQS